MVCNSSSTSCQIFSNRSSIFFLRKFDIKISFKSMIHKTFKLREICVSNFLFFSTNSISYPHYLISNLVFLYLEPHFTIPTNHHPLIKISFKRYPYFKIRRLRIRIIFHFFQQIRSIPTSQIYQFLSSLIFTLL